VNPFFAHLKSSLGKFSPVLTFDGWGAATNTDNATYTNYLYASLVTHAGEVVHAKVRELIQVG